MSLTIATLLPGLLLIALGALFLCNHAAIVTSLKRLPRSRSAALIFFGIGAAWFLFRIWHLSEADFGQYRRPLFVFFAAVAVGAFVYVPDFLAVRGLAVIFPCLKVRPTASSLPGTNPQPLLTTHPLLSTKTISTFFSISVSSVATMRKPAANSMPRNVSAPKGRPLSPPHPGDTRIESLR